MDKLEKELKLKMIDNEIIVKMQKDMVASYLQNEDISTSVTTSFNREIIKIKKMVFDEDQVTVTFYSKVEKEVKYLESNNEEEEKEISKKTSFNPSEETITLKNVDGKWKVVYADLQYQDYFASHGMTTMVY